ncbi:MAG TPA: folate-binding protein [Halothiobacillus sp.]|nr:folate-binding protein [Halothiobacillus sp.]
MQTTLPGWLSGHEDDNQLPDFPAHADTQRLLCRLDQLGLIEVTGDDSRSFLQNMLSNDVRQVSMDSAQLTSLCTPKGRMLAILVALQRYDKLLLQLPKDNLLPTIKRLQLFVLRSKVTLSDVSDQLHCLGLIGPSSDELLDHILGNAPRNRFGSLTRDGITVIRHPGDTPRYQLICDDASLEMLWPKLQSQVIPARGTAWELTEIQAGIPSVYESSREHFVPQWANLDLLDGVSFKKGCYPGQEVVARLHYLGKPNRRMLAGRVALETPPPPGMTLHVNDEGQQEAGEIVRASHHPDGDIAFLAVMRLSMVKKPIQIGGQPVWLDTSSLPPETEDTGAPH